jgi:hypothetical protein
MHKNHDLCKGTIFCVLRNHYKMHIFIFYDSKIDKLEAFLYFIIKK